MAKEYVIEGTRVSSLETFYDEISRVLVPGQVWGRNLDALDDILRGGFGTPSEGFVLRWRDADASRHSLGHAETVRQLQIRLEHCHPSNRAHVQRALSLAQAGQGETVFDWLVEIVLDHGDSGAQRQDQVSLQLE